MISFLNGLGLGGTEKAAVRWASGLQERGHEVALLSLADGPRRGEVEASSIPLSLCPGDPKIIWERIAAINPDVIHAHGPGYPHPGDVLGAALKLGKRIPVVQTNIFGRLENPAEDEWINHRLFISWTSCVQAAERSFRPISPEFFRTNSVAVYPLDAEEPASEEQVQNFRTMLGVATDDVLFGRFSRPEPNKWTPLPLDAFRLACKGCPNLKFLMQEAPPAVAAELRNAPDRDRFLLLPATSDRAALRLAISSVDVVLHTSLIGESFGYGVAEPMNLGKPVITNSTPWQDQAQLELVAHGECGFHASTARMMARRMVEMARDRALRVGMGSNAKARIRQLADVEQSLNRLEASLFAAVQCEGNRYAEEDLALALAARAGLRRHRLGHSFEELYALAPLYLRVRFSEFRRALKTNLLHQTRFNDP